MILEAEDFRDFKGFTSKDMTYITIDIEGKNLYLDMDKKRTACRHCGEMIRFAQDNMGTFYTVEKLVTEWCFHNKVCKKKHKSNLEKNIESEERNQEFLNAL